MPKPPGDSHGRGGRDPARGSAEGVTLLESVAEAVVGVDEGGRIALANSHMERLFGYGHHELLGESIDQVVPDGIPLPNAGVGLLHGTLGLDARRKDGTGFPAEICVSPLMQTATGLLGQL